MPPGAGWFLVPGTVAGIGNHDKLHPKPPNPKSKAVKSQFRFCAHVEQTALVARKLLFVADNEMWMFDGEMQNGDS
jgi:hypothetical protein